VLELFASNFTENKVVVNFNTEKACHVNVDKNQIEQVLINLFSNSLNSFQGIEKPIITIDITADSFRTNLKVTDNGIGISEDIQDKIFIPYFTTRKNGSGIGLTLSKSIMEAHGGSINFSSKNGSTSFVLVFTGNS
jgi:signal transduction histidine kinase